MRIIYNDIELEVVRTIQYGRRVVYDDLSSQDAVMVEWDVEVVAVYNPQATSFTLNAAGQAVSQKGQAPVLTDRAIRHALMEQQRVLEVRGNSDPPEPVGTGNLLLRSPALLKFCDARGGPYPQECNIVSVMGSPKTLMIYWRCKTFTWECREGINLVITSHRWRQYVDVNAQHLATRVTEGVATFRADELVSRGTLPDEYRQSLVHEVPKNFVREHVHVEATADGTKLRYVTVDVERTHNLGENSPATQVEAYHTEFSHVPAGAAFVNNAVGGLGDFIMGGGRWGALFRFAKASMPRFYTHVFVRAWTDRLGNRQDLVRLALGIALARIGNNVVRKILPSIEVTLTRDLTGKFIELQILREHPPGVTSILGIAPNWDALRRDPETITHPDTGAVLVDAGEGENRPLPHARESRGSWRGQVAAQGLDSSPCALPTDPSNPVRDDRSVDAN